MAKLFEVSVQVVTDDAGTTSKVQTLMEKALHHLKISDVYVRETNYAGEIEEDPFEDPGADEEPSI